MIAIKLPMDIEARLANLAKQTGRSKTFYATRAVIEHIEGLEDYYAAEAAYRDFTASGEKAIPWDQVKKGLDNAVSD